MIYYLIITGFARSASLVLTAAISSSFQQERAKFDTLPTELRVDSNQPIAKKIVAIDYVYVYFATTQKVQSSKTGQMDRQTCK